jgi:acetoin utilization deacetylase AcuC-like enzyme
MELPVINHPDYVAKINDDNKFPIKKFGALAKHLLDTGTVKKFFKPKECSVETLRTSHSLEYINHIKNKTLDVAAQKKIGFPINDSVVRRSFVATGGTVLASKLALDSKLACNTAGGSHHATFNFGAGYCVFNDVAVAANYLKNKGYVKKILILDLDVHQGNGNSEIFQNDKDVFTFSMHCASNYPAKKSKSDMDVELNDNMEDEEYLNTLNENIKLLNKNNYDFVFYVAGVDIHFNDKLGKLKITDEGINKRDQMVIENFFSKQIPLCGVLGGGYNKSFEKLIELHSMLHKNCADNI